MANEKNTQSFVEHLQEAELLPIYVASLISADTLVTTEDCDDSEEKLLELQDGFTKSNRVFLKEKWLKRIEDALEIVRRDREDIRKEIEKLKGDRK